jgi:hypothetical protein
MNRQAEKGKHEELNSYYFMGALIQFFFPISCPRIYLRILVDGNMEEEAEGISL